MATNSERGARRGLLAGLGLLALLIPACGPPQVSPPNREIVSQLATATSARNAEWLEACAASIESRRSEGELTESDDAAFAPILAAARAGRWDEARDAAYALRDAQQPTAEDLAAVRSRTLPEPKTPPGARPRGAAGAG